MKPINDKDYQDVLKTIMSTADSIATKIQETQHLIQLLPFIPGDEDVLKQRQALEHHSILMRTALTGFLDAVEYNSIKS